MNRPEVDEEATAKLREAMGMDIAPDGVDYVKLGLEIGRLVIEKQYAYGDSFGKSGRILEVLFPDGIQPSQYPFMLAVTRIVDKLFRIASDPEAMGEEPFADLVGYGLLGLAMSRGLRNDQKKEKRT